MFCSSYRALGEVNVEVVYSRAILINNLASSVVPCSRCAIPTQHYTHVNTRTKQAPKKGTDVIAASIIHVAEMCSQMPNLDHGGNHSFVFVSADGIWNLRPHDLMPNVCAIVQFAWAYVFAAHHLSPERILVAPNILL